MADASDIRLPPSKIAELKRVVQRLHALESAIARLEECTEDCGDLQDIRRTLEERYNRLLERWG